MATGRAPAPGTRLGMAQLAESFRAVAEGGRDAFYRGGLARRIVEASTAMGGIYTLEDFSTYEARWAEPIGVRYRGLDVFTAPPNCSGFQVLQTLKLLETFPSDELSFQHPDTVHATIESVKLSMTDRVRYAGDPDYTDIPLDGLLSESYAAEQRTRIDMDSAASLPWEKYTADVPEGSLSPGDVSAHSGGMTTHFAAADREGNVVTITQTLGGGFGSAVAIGDTGIFLNNMMSLLRPRSGEPQRHRSGQAGRLRGGADADLPRRTLHAEPWHARRLRDPPDDDPGARPRTRLRDERAAGDRRAALQVLSGPG